MANKNTENEEINPSDYETVTLSLDNDEEVECVILRRFPAGENNYIALLPISGSYVGSDDAFLYRYTISDHGEPILENIESDEEYEIVADAFDEELDAMEYEELYAEEDAEESDK